MLRISLLLFASVGIGCNHPDAGVDGPRDGAIDGRTDVPDGAPPTTSRSFDAKLLVISADGSEPTLGAIRQALDFQGTPYTVWIATLAPGTLTADQLFVGLHGRFQGVILASGELSLTAVERQALDDYELQFGVREAVLFSEPTPGQGFGDVTEHDTSAAPITATLTTAGRGVFPYLTGSLTIDDGDAYLATVADDQTTPLLVDAGGHALITVRTQTDGRESLALAFDGAPASIHTIALCYGVINWVTRGLFIGERHVFAGPQVDDVFLGNLLFAGGVYRITGDDLRAFAAWQQVAQQRPSTPGMIVTQVFNGKGTTGMYSPDTLTPAARELQAQFRWVSHTWSHEDLDVADYATTAEEIELNNDLALDWDLEAYDPRNIMTPGHSGIFHAPAMQAMVDQGIDFMISNTSHADENNPFPNVGIRNALQPGVLQIPRHPTEIYFDVTTPAEEVAAYQARHPSNPRSYEQILDRESDRLLRWMLVGDIDPWMFHQGNLRAYDGSSSLLSDLIDRTLDKYDAIYNLPVLTLAQDDLGAQVATRTERHDSVVTGIIVPGASITLTVDRDATIPVTGLHTATAETYGGQEIAHVRVVAGESITIPLP